MGTSDRIERERQAKRTLILEAARELFLERGYEAVTLREVAQRIEHSTTAVYVHFKDKRDLIEQMVAEDFEKFGVALHSAAAVTPALVRLERLGEAYVNFALTLPRHYQLMFLAPRPQDAEPSPEEVPVGLDGFGLLLSTVEACIAEGAFRPELQDARAIAQSVWAAVHGLVSLFIVMGDMPHFEWRTPKVLFDTLMGSMLRGMAVGPLPPKSEALAALPAAPAERKPSKAPTSTRPTHGRSSKPRC